MACLRMPSKGAGPAQAACSALPAGDEPQVCHLAVPEVWVRKQASISLQSQAALPAPPVGNGPRAEELRQRIGEKHQQMHGFTSAEDELRDARRDMEENLRELKGALHARSGCP